jgi:hypothetical protein
MIEILKLATSALYVGVGAISLVMAGKTLFSGSYLPFHKEAAGMTWEEVPAGLQRVILALMRISGLGFLCTGLLLVLLPVLIFTNAAPGVVYIIVPTAFVFCSGLFIINYNLFRRTGAQTPWKGALAAMAIIIVALVLTVLAGH